MNNLFKINEFLTKGMLAVFTAIVPLVFLTMLIPILGYVVAVLLIILMFNTFLSLFFSAILMGYEITKFVDGFFKLKNEQRQ